MKRMNLNEMKSLSRSEMKKIMAGSGGCQTLYQSCNSVTHVNCCSGLVCASGFCQNPTR